MLGINNHTFIINEKDSTGLFRLIDCLENNKIIYCIGNDFILIDSKDLIINWKIISNYLITNKLTEVFRNGYTKKSTIKIKSNRILIKDYWITLGTGAWKYIGKDNKLKGLKELLLSSDFRLLNSFKCFINYGLLDNSIINSLKKNNPKIYKKLIDLVYSIKKVEILESNNKTSNEILEEFIKKKDRVNCIPWKENGKCGIWITSLKYYNSISQLPKNKVIFIDQESRYNKYRISGKGVCIIYFKNIKSTAVIKYSWKPIYVSFINKYTDITLEEYKYMIDTLINNGFINRTLDIRFELDTDLKKLFLNII